MNARALLDELRRRGVRLTADGGHIDYRAPKGAMTSECLAALKEHKSEIMQLLEAEATVSGQDGTATPGTTPGRPVGGDVNPAVLMTIGARHSYPRLPLKAGVSIAGGEAAWQTFTRTADADTLHLAVESARATRWDDALVNGLRVEDGEDDPRCQSCGDRLQSDTCRWCELDPPAAAQDRPALHTGGLDRLLRGDCRDVLPTLPADSVQLLLTSPPFNIGWDYGDGGAGDRRPLDEYLALLAEALHGCYRVLRSGGVLALNLPATIRRPDCCAWPLASWAQMHLLANGWVLREPLVWMKSSKDGQPLAMGLAMGGPANPYLRPCHELVLLASKAEPRMANKKGWPDEDRYIEWLKDVWPLPPARARRGEPPAFPDALVRRLVSLFSAVDDVVLDPFGGTGTVGRVARGLERHAWLIEREPTYWPRIEAALGLAPDSEAR
jgi:DNA modification methylase